MLNWLKKIFQPKILPDINYEVDKFILHLQDRRTIAQDFGETNSYVKGYTKIRSREIYVNYEFDKNGNPIPDLECLGHEVLHLVLGDWHK